MSCRTYQAKPGRPTFRKVMDKSKAEGGFQLTSKDEGRGSSYGQASRCAAAARQDWRGEYRQLRGWRCAGTGMRRIERDDGAGGRGFSDCAGARWRFRGGTGGAHGGPDGDVAAGGRGRD